MMKNCSTLFALVVVVACFSLIAGCASSAGRSSHPTAVPQIRPGVPAGYLTRNALPNSPTLLPPFLATIPAQEYFLLFLKRPIFLLDYFEIFK
jgi:hypothetical protein